MSYKPKVNADSLTLYLGIAATGRATASSTTLDMVSFGTVYNPRPDVTFTPDDEGMPIAVIGGGPVDPDMPPVYFVQGALFHTTIASYVSPTEVILTDAPDTSIFNTGFATVILYRPIRIAADFANIPAPFQLNTSIAPGTNDTLQFSTFQNFDRIPNDYVARFGPPLRGQPVYLTREDDDLGLIEEFGGYVSRLTTYSQAGVSQAFAWALQCTSWSGLARRRQVPPANPQVFTDVAGDEVFKKVVLDYLSDDGVSATADSAPSITLACAVGANIGQLLDQVVSLVGDETTAWYWTTDAWRNFILATRSATAAPWNVSGGADLFTGDIPYQQTSEVSTDQVANFVYGIGQNVLLNTLNATFSGNGTNSPLNTPLPIGAQPTITLNGGSPLAVGILGVDSGKAWYWSQDSTTLTPDAGNTPLSATDALLVVYLAAVPGVAQAPNVGSLQSLQAIEATSGKYDYSLTVDAPILPNDLLALCTAYETEYGDPAVTNTLYTLRPGLQIGQLQDIDYAGAGIAAGSYLIATVQLTIFQNVLMWQYTAFGGANIVDSITALTQFINRQQPGGSGIVTPSVPITGPPTPLANNAVIAYGPPSNAVAFPGNVSAGDLLVCVLAQEAFLANPPTLTDTQGNTWTLAKFQSATGLAPIQVAILWAIAGSSGPNTVTFTNAVGGTTITMGLAEFSGVVQTAPVDVTGGSIGSTPSSVTTTQDGDIIITILSGLTSASTATPPEAILAQVASGDGTVFSWDQLAGTGAYTSSLTHSSSGLPSAWATVAFKRATATAPPAQSTDVIGNPGGTVSNSGTLTADLPVFGAGSTVIKVGTKQGNTDKAQMASGSAGGTGAPLLYDANGNAVAGTTGQLVPPGGSTNQVLAKASATSGDTAWVNPGGGGSGNSISYGTYASLPGSGTTMGDMYVCTDSPYTFIWSGSVWLAFLPAVGQVTLPPTSGWTWDTQGGSSVVATYGNLYVSFAGFGSDDARAYYRTVSGAFTMKMLCKVVTWKTTSAQSGVGIAISDGTKYLFFGGFDFTGQSVIPRILVQYWSTISSPVATLAQLTNYSSAAPAGGIGLWLGCVVDATHITFYVSIDGGGAPGSGANWIQVYQEALAAHLGTITRAGVGGYLNTASDLNVLSLSGI
jgi:hypothetical protein